MEYNSIKERNKEKEKMEIKSEFYRLYMIFSKRI